MAWLVIEYFVFALDWAYYLLVRVFSPLWVQKFTSIMAWFAVEYAAIAPDWLTICYYVCLTIYHMGVVMREA